MSSDLHDRELAERLSGLEPTTTVEPGVWTGFVRGTPQMARRAVMRGLSGVDLLGSVGPIVQDAFTGGTEAQDRYFKEHDEIYGRAMEHLTPKPGEVGIAGMIAGELLGTLPFIFTVPGPTIGAIGVGETEELLRRGAPLKEASQVGAIQAASMGLGLYVPILGRTLAQRILIGGAGFNVAQGTVTRAASAQILKDHPELAKDYAALDPAYLTLDVLLGLAFGGFAHVNPAMRAQGAEGWQRIAEWLQDTTPEQKAALAAMRQAQHMAADSLPGRPAEPKDAAFHVERVRRAVEQMARNEPVDVSDLPEARTEPLEAVQAERAENMQTLIDAAEEVRGAEGLPPVPEAPAPRRLVPEDLTLVPVEGQARAIGQAVENRLLELKVNEVEARANAALWEAFFDTTAKKYGVTPGDLISSYGIDIRRMSKAEAMPGAFAQPERPPMARPGEEGYAPGRGETPETRQAPGAARAPEDLPATVAGGRPAQGWTRATRASRAGRPIELFRGAAQALRPEDFRPDSLGWASDNPSAGLGVWFTPSRAEASTYGEPAAAYLDIRNPKVVKVEDLPGFNDVREAIAWREELRRQGHDAVVVTAKHLGGKTHIAVFEPDQVIPNVPTEPRPGETLFQAAARSKLLETARYRAWLEGQGLESKFWSLGRKPAKGERERYSAIRAELGLPEVKDWSARPEQLVQRLEPPARYEEQRSLFQEETRYGIEQVDEKGQYPEREVRQARRARPPEGEAAPQRDLFAETEVSRKKEPQPPVVVRLARQGELRVGIDRVTSLKDAAHVFAALRKSPREYFQILITDAEGRPLSAFDIARGTITQTSVYPREVLTAVYMTPGAKRVFFAHNHPSGIPQPSQADIHLTDLIAKGLGPSLGVEFGGHVIIAGKRAATFMEGGDIRETVDIPPAPRTKAVPIMERVIARQSFEKREPLTSPGAARDWIRKAGLNEEGLLLLDAQHQVLTFMPMSSTEMQTLRTGDPTTGGGRLFAMVGKLNPAAVMAFTPGPENFGFTKGVSNISTALNLLDVKVLDGFFRPMGGPVTGLGSMAERGTIERFDVFFQSEAVQKTFYSELERQIGQASMRAAPAKAWKDYLKGLAGKGVKADEVRWSGIEEWLDLQEGRVSKDQVVEFLKGNGVKVEETVLGGDLQAEVDATEKALTQHLVANEHFTERGAREYALDAARGQLSESQLSLQSDEARRLAGALEAAYMRREQGNPAVREWDDLDRELGDMGYELNMEPDTNTAAMVLTSVEHIPSRTVYPFEPDLGFVQPEGIEGAPPLPARVTEIGARLSELESELPMTSEGERADQTRFHTYQLAGERRNYRELVLTTPVKLKGKFEYPEPLKMLPVGYEPITDFAQPASTQWAVIPPGQEHGRPWAGRHPSKEAAIEAALKQYNEIRNETYATQWRAQNEGRAFTGGHFEIDNTLAHVRFNERLDPQGRKVLFIEEIQSDWAQRGREAGFIGKTEEEAKRFFKISDEDWARATPETRAAHVQDMVNAVRDGRVGRGTAVPAGPFVQKTEAWVGLTLKRMIRWAVDNGFERVAWTRGEQQVARYTQALRNNVDRIEWKKTPEGVQLTGYKGREAPKVDSELDRAVRLILRENAQLGFQSQREARDAILQNADWRQRYAYHGMTTAELSQIETWRVSVLHSVGGEARRKVVDTTQKEDVLSDAIGKSMADRIKQDPNQAGVIEGENIRIDDTGMATFYDRIVPNVANDILKKLGGGRVQDVVIGKTEDAVPPHAEIVETTRSYMRGDMGNGEFREALGVDISDERIAQALEAHVERGGRAEYEIAREFATMVRKEFGGAPKSKQMGFDITPEMREKALAGMPLFQGGKRGAIRMGELENVIALFEESDASTFLHESGHLFLQITRDLASRGGAPLEALSDWATLARWLGIEGGEITRAQHEKFATSFERYLAEGKAPSPELRSVFQQFRDWLLAIYRRLADIAEELPDEIRGVMDRMLSSERADPTPKAEGPPRAEVEPPPPPGRAEAAGRPEAPELRGLDDAQIRETVRAMADFEIGWAEVGGRLIRQRTGERAGQETISRTKWIPKSDFWPGRPDKRMTEAGAREAVRKALAGEPLRPIEQRLIDDMVKVANERTQAIDQVGGPEEWDALARETVEAELEPSTQNVLDTDLVARAAEKDEIAVERAAQKYENDDAAFMAEVRKILGPDIEDRGAPGGGEEDAGAAPGGERPGEGAGAQGEAEDPVAAAAREYVDAHPDQMVVVGTDPDGQPIVKSMRQYLDDALLEAADAREDASLVRAAAKCLYGAS